MELGDFSALAKSYYNRPGYSLNVLLTLKHHIESTLSRNISVADIGAGTGKLTADLLSIDLHPIAVEPNDAMRTEGARLVGDGGIVWQAGSGEATGLNDISIDWALMGSSFHWVDTKKGLTEFHRILRPAGFFTAIWNPRDLIRSEFHTNLEEKIKSFIPNVKRHSSGSGEFTNDLDLKLISSGLFRDCLFIEDRYELELSPERYLGAWDSVNDLQAQAGPENWGKIVQLIKSEISGMKVIKVPYKTRAWTVQKV